MESWQSAYVAGIIDGEGSITLTRMQKNEFRRPCIVISSTDYELLLYIQTLTGGLVTNKKNYDPERHKDSYTLTIKKKKDVFLTLENVSPFLRVKQKRRRAEWILNHYNQVTPRNGKYSPDMLKRKLLFEKTFFKI